MFDLRQLLLYFMTASLLAIMPGPGIFYVAARTLAGGRGEGIASSVGTGVGGLAHVLAGSLGVSAIVLASAELFDTLKLLGAAYLIWLGFRTFRSAKHDVPMMRDHDPSRLAIGMRRAFRDGVLVEALNPKTAAFFVAFIPHFVDPAAGPVAFQFIVLGFISVALNTLADVAVAFVASGVRDSARARPAVVRRLRQGSGAAMIALGFGLALTKRPIA